MMQVRDRRVLTGVEGVCGSSSAVRSVTAGARRCVWGS